MKKVVIISTSLRKNSNSDILAKEFYNGAVDGGNEVEFISLVGKDIKYCIGCLSCQKTGKCVIKDDVTDRREKIGNADVVVFATPIYYYEMSGQMKTLIDRLNPLYNSAYNFKEVYLIATAADDDKNTFDGVLKGIEGFIYCYENTSLKGKILGYGLDGAGEVKDKLDLLKNAYEMGKKV